MVSGPSTPSWKKQVSKSGIWNFWNAVDSRGHDELSNLTVCKYAATRPVCYATHLSTAMVREILPSSLLIHRCHRY